MTEKIKYVIGAKKPQAPTSTPRTSSSRPSSSCSAPAPCTPLPSSGRGGPGQRGHRQAPGAAASRGRSPVEKPTERRAGQWRPRRLEVGSCATPRTARSRQASWTEKGHTRGSARRGGAAETERQAPPEQGARSGLHPKALGAVFSLKTPSLPLPAGWQTLSFLAYSCLLHPLPPLSQDTVPTSP
ncbi:unnamed protein product [Nyctereutes procyonoides]|uniref:(raccoon dog) hypothetical protein n=1 Tax=Nyctereutes procyonoides TaxID=34880 RepID=A0A811ZQT9_NYCPR|nr:unnamed protein product [Nyctereutes procyonoides]